MTRHQVDIPALLPTIRTMAFDRKNVFAALLLWLLPVMGWSAEEAPLKPEVKQRLELLRAGFDSFVLKTVTIPFEEGLAKLGDKAVPALKRESNAAAERTLHRATLMVAARPFVAAAMVAAAFAIPAIHREEKHWTAQADFDALKSGHTVFVPRFEAEYGKWIAQETLRRLDETLAARKPRLRWRPETIPPLAAE